MFLTMFFKMQKIVQTMLIAHPYPWEHFDVFHVLMGIREVIKRYVFYLVNLTE